jgi:hypothetical protein
MRRDTSYEMLELKRRTLAIFAFHFFVSHSKQSRLRWCKLVILRGSILRKSKATPNKTETELDWN